MTSDGGLDESPYGDDVYEAGVEDAEFLDPAETLTGEDLDEPLDAGYSPPDFEPPSLRRGTTFAEQREGESLDQRLAEEVPDVSPDDLANPNTDRAGRLVLADTERDELPSAIDVGKDGSGASAEEAAVHIVDEDEYFGA